MTTTMEKSEIIKGDVLIANFMEWEPCEYTERVTNPQHPGYKAKHPPIKAFCLPDDHPIVRNIYTDVPGYCWDYNKEDEFGNTINRLIFFYEDLKFSSSWDWLIPVIDKITSLNEYSKFIDYTASMVSEGGIYINTKYIENTYSEVVNFIEWYNKQPK